MSYTNGGQTIDKSMNGIITISDGQGTTISNGVITTNTINASSLNVPSFECDNLVVNISSDFTGTSTFNNGLSALALITSTGEIHSNTLISSGTDITADGVVIAPYLNATSAVYFGVNQLIQAAVLTEKLIFTNLATPSGSRAYQFFNGTTSLLLMENALITLGVATTTAANITLTGTAKLTAPTITSNILYFDTAELVKAQVLNNSRCIFSNSSSLIAGRNYEFTFPGATSLIIEPALITLGVATTTASNVSLTGTSVLSLASGTSLSLASGSSMSSAGNISLTSAANLTTSASGIFFNSGQDISIKALLSQLQFNIASSATAPRSYQFKLAALTPLLIEATTTTITNSATATSNVNALEIKNSEGTPSQINFLLNAVAATANPNVAAGDDVIYSNGSILNLTTTSATAVGIRMSPTDIETKANTTTLTGTTLNNNIATTTFSGAQTNLSSTTTTIAGTTCNHNSTTNSFTGTTTNLTSGTTNINGTTLTTISTPTTTITGTQTNLNAITNNINGTNTNIASTGAFDITSPTTNIGGTNCNITGTGALGITCPTTNIGGTNCNINGTGTCTISSATGTTIKSAQTASSAGIALTIINSVVSPNPNAVSVACNLGGGNYNGIVQAGDAAIIAGGAVGTQNLCITSHSNTSVGIRITGAGAVAITGATTISSSVALANGSTTTTQAATDSSTAIATTQFVNRAAWETNPLSIYFNVGVGGGSGLLNLKTMNYDPLYANAPVLTNANMNFTAIRLDQGTTYTGMTTYYSVSPAGGTIRLALFSAAGALLASTGTYTSVGTIGHHSLNFTSVYTPSTLQMVYATSYVLVATTINQMSSSTGAASAVNCSPAPTATACNGRSFFITKPATFPTTLTGVAKTATAITFWYGLY